MSIMRSDAKKTDRQEKIDDIIAGISEAVLKTMLAGGALGIALIAPNAIRLLDKPLARYFKKLDARAQERQMRQTLHYMKRKGWISGSDRNYEHGLRITNRGKLRLGKMQMTRLAIVRPERWDRRWRLVFFDIPEVKRAGRDALTRRLKSLGFYMLQRSVLVHPFPCRAEVEKIALAYGMERYVSYVETEHIDRQEVLMKKFAKLL